ncbi:MAG: hypothetical protein JO013_16035, partial [Alphaproteobacteria bacterium]|nr:hypothetical protein [Alphaproteobacteria bacterium]
MSTFQLTAAKPADVQISNDGKTVYASWDDGYIRAYSTATGALIHAWHVGTDLGRMDLSPDGSFLMVVEDHPVSTNFNQNSATTYYDVAVYKFSLAAQTAQTFLYTTKTNSEYTFFDLGVITSNKVLVTEGATGSGFTGPKLLDLTTGQFSPATFYPSGTTTDHAWIAATPDGSKVLVGEGNISSAQLDVYVPGVGATRYDAGSGYNAGVQAISNDGNLIAQYVYGYGLTIYDGSLHPLVNLNSAHPEWASGNALGLTFDPTGSFLYVLNTGTDTIDKVSTGDWHTVSTIPLGFDAGSYPQVYNATDDLLQLDPTGHFFTVMAPSGLQLVANPDAPPINGTEGDDDIQGTVADDTINGLGGDDFVQASAGADVVHGGTGYDVLYGEDGNDVLYGDAADDILHGDAGNDQLYGGDGDDYLRGGAGVDSYDGGSDTGANPGTLVGDQVSFYERGATQGAVADLRTGIVSNDGFGNVETMTGIETLGAGTAYADTFYGNDSANGLSAETGDSLYGFGGDDFFLLRGAGFVDGGTGIDTLTVSSVGNFYVPGAGGPGHPNLAPAMTTGWTIDLTAGTLHDGYGNNGTVTGIENVTGSDLGDTITGGAGANVLNGGGGDDILDGGAGADTMAGGTGNDLYVVDDAGDVVTENANEGYDEVRTALAAYTLAANVEKLTYTGSVAATLRGNGGDNFITGGPAADTFQLWDGGHDHAVGGGGYDIFTFGGAFDAGDVVEGGTGYDDIHIQGAYATITLGANLSGVETVRLYGHAYQEGNPGANPYNYQVVINGITTETNSLYVGAALAANETITIDGSAVGYTRLAIEGGDGNDVLVGGLLDDWISGGAGADTMSGGAGSDTYIVDNIGDVVIEKPGEGSDTVSVSLATYTLPDNVENIQGFNIDQHLTGNAADNQIYGYGGNDVIDGGAGADRMVGGEGDDVYYVDNANDVVIENAGEGTDEVRTTIANYALPANVEKLTYVGTGNWTFTGGAGNDNVAASGGNDFFDLSQGGADTASGGGGNDAFSFGAAFGAGDSVDGGAGSDTVGIRGNYTGANKLVIGAGQLVN